MPARFITFEGLDGSGKSTHMKRAVSWLEGHGHAVTTSYEPGGTPLGEAIRSLFLDRKWKRMDGRIEAMLMFASRRQLLAEVVEPALASGHFVLLDRFTDSTRAYQGYGRDLPLGWIADLDHLATDGRQPDATLLFDLPADAAQRRGQSQGRQDTDSVDRLDAEALAFYERVRRGYLAMAEADPKRVHVIDSRGTHEETWQQVERTLATLTGN